MNGGTGVCGMLACKRCECTVHGTMLFQLAEVKKSGSIVRYYLSQN